MASSRSVLLCAAFDCSNNKSVQKVRDLFRFQKEQFVVVYRKKDERSGGHQGPGLFKLNKINNPRSKC